MTSLEESVSLEAAILCREYIYHRLQPPVSDTAGRRPEIIPLFQQPMGTLVHDTAQELKTVGANLYNLYPSLFEDIFSQLNVRLTSEEVVDEVLTAVASEILQSGITWARVVAVFVVAESLAAECVQQRLHDYTVFVDRLVRSLTNFIRERLVKWIVGQGGWGNMKTTFRGIKQDNSNVLMIIGVLGAVCGVAGTIIATGKLREVF